MFEFKAIVMFSRQLIKRRLFSVKSKNKFEPIFRPYTSSQHLEPVLNTWKKLPNIAQGVRGAVELITGNFSYFTKYEAEAIESSLKRGKTFILVFDRDNISVPANERAMWIREYFQHHPDLEVRIAYSPPPEKEGNEERYVPYIKKQLSPHIQVTAVGCGNHYSALLSQALDVPVNPMAQLIHSETMDQEIKQNPAAYEDILFPVIAKRVISPFQQIIDEDEFKQLCEIEMESVKADIERLNPNHPNQDGFFKRTPWNPAALNNINLPIVVGSVAPEYRLAFSNSTNAQVFDMPVYMEKKWKIPKELSPYKHLIARIVAAESLANCAMDEGNVYITVDCGVVPPDSYARREGRHVDGFLSKFNARAGKDGVIWGDNTYVVSNSQALQTELYPGPFDLSRIDHNDARAFLQALEIQGQNMRYKQANAYDIVRLTTNTPHAVHQNDTGQYLLRSFVKVTSSDRLFNRSGNTVNPNFNYRFMYVPRGIGRNTQNFTGAPPTGFLDIDLKEIDFKHSKFPSCVSQKPFNVRKKTDVQITAVPANEGETLETMVSEQLVTLNIARKGDMKVTRIDKDSYFLGSNFFKLYKKVDEDKYIAASRMLVAVRVLQNISFLASWGTRQNIPAGGYIVQDNEGSMWGVHQQSFKATYETVEDNKPCLPSPGF